MILRTKWPTVSSLRTSAYIVITNPVTSIMESSCQILIMQLWLFFCSQENRVGELEADYEQSQSDLKLAFKRISDLKAALEDSIGSDDDFSDRYGLRSCLPWIYKMEFPLCRIGNSPFRISVVTGWSHLCSSVAVCIFNWSLFILNPSGSWLCPVYVIPNA